MTIELFLSAVVTIAVILLAAGLIVLYLTFRQRSRYWHKRQRQHNQRPPVRSPMYDPKQFRERR